MNSNENKNWDEAGVEAGEFEAFRQVVAELRGEHGCPWDKKQTFDSLKPCMINEMTEAIAGINIYKQEKDADNLCEELGDVLLQVVLLAQIAEEEGLFRMEDVIRGISRKMIRRHPHVFPNPELEAYIKEQENRKTNQSFDSNNLTAGEIPGRWELIKQAEKKQKTLQQKLKEKEAFKEAAREVVDHLS